MDSLPSIGFQFQGTSGQPFTVTIGPRDYLWLATGNVVSPVKVSSEWPNVWCSGYLPVFEYKFAHNIGYCIRVTLLCEYSTQYLIDRTLELDLLKTIYVEHVKRMTTHLSYYGDT